MIWLNAHWRALRDTWHRLGNAPAASLLNIAIIGIALSLPLGAYVVLESVRPLAGLHANTAEISLFLTDRADVPRLQARLQALPQIERVQFVPRDQALAQLRAAADMKALLDDLPRNPLPDAFIVTPTTTDAAALDGLRREIAAWPGVDHVQLDTDWVHKLEGLLGFARLAIALLAALLGVALIAITFNTIRLQILTRREEIEVAQLIGASDAFIRRPFLYFGLIQGLLGGLLAWALVAAGIGLLNLKLETLTELYASSFRLSPLPPADTLSLLAFAALLGWLGAWLSVSQHLWRIESD